MNSPCSKYHERFDETPETRESRKRRAAFLRFETVPVDRGILDRAAALEPAALRSLDAVHVATALAISSSDLVFFSYDHRTIEAAQLYGLTVSSPGA